MVPLPTFTKFASCYSDDENPASCPFNVYGIKLKLPRATKIAEWSWYVIYSAVDLQITSLLY